MKYTFKNTFYAFICVLFLISWKADDNNMNGAYAQPSTTYTSGIIFYPSLNWVTDVDTAAPMSGRSIMSVPSNKSVMAMGDSVKRRDNRYADSVALAMVNGIHAPTFNNGIVRAFNSNYTISALYPSFFCYSVTVATTINLTTTSSSGSVFPEYSTNGGTTWITLPQVSNSGTLSTLVTLSALSSQSFQVNGWVPANALVRLRTSFTGTVNFTYLNGQEYY